ncbi:MAG: translation elongation factor Ts [Sphingobacteriaceae bacterium]|nr:translation elongation factor Ts [Sphingobacteriaceae bacterium]
MNITAADVNKLRQLTGAGMMDCKKALTEANGDFEEAVVILRKKGQKVSASRADREANEGVIIALTSADATFGLIAEVTCETDFVAKNEEFGSLAQEIATIAMNKNISDKEALLQEHIGGITIAEKLIEYTGKIGEKISLHRLVTVAGEGVVSYVHSNNKLGVLVALNHAANAEVEAAGKDVAMQIAAMNPVAVDKGDVDPSVIEREIEIGKDQARQEGKPEAIVEKIAMGKLNKFYQDNTLLNQAFVKDNGVNIAQMLDKVAKGLTVKSFARVAIGS